MIRRFWPFALFAFALAACSSNGSSTIPPTMTVSRGAVISVTHTATLSKTAMEGGEAGPFVTAIGGAPRCDVDVYAVRYKTIGAKGEPADASAGFYVPGRGCKGPYLLIGYSQGTNFNRAMNIAVPSKQNPEPLILAGIYAAHGYVVAATDYLGLGYSTYPYEPYLVMSAEASAEIDAMRAIHTAAKSLHVPLSGKVFLQGYSQGGHSTIAVQRAIAAEAPSEFDVIANQPGSGMYALTNWVQGNARKPPSDGEAAFFAFLVPGYNKAYGNIYSDPSQTFKEPYAGYVDALLPVNTYAEQKKLAGKTLPMSLDALMQPGFFHDLFDDPKSGVRQDLTANEPLSGWKPTTPIYLCGGHRDPVVDYKNSRIAYAFLKGEGVKVALLDLDSSIPASIPFSQYHDAIFVLCTVVERVQVLDPAIKRAQALRFLPRDR
jgi:predicted esterase